MEYAVEMRGITMQFPAVRANDNVDFSVLKGEIHALVGENGAGKSTLMNILYGLYSPTAGEVHVNGRKTEFHSALDAIQAGIGMVHQHFMLIPRMTVAENVVLGAEPRKNRLYDRKQAGKEVEQLSAQYDFSLPARAIVRDISLGMQQRVEIAKALYRKADIIILDEPTAVLTPQEIDELGNMLQQLKSIGKTIIIITHKMKEIMDFSDRITVLRAGKKVITVNTEETDANQITEYMVGREVHLGQGRKSYSQEEVMLEFQNVSYQDKVKNVSFKLKKGEILGIAGIDNSGQKEITELAAGILTPDSGKIIHNGMEVKIYSAKEIKESGTGFVPQDRHRHGLVLGMSVEDNLLLGYQRLAEFRNKKVFLNRKAVSDNAIDKIKNYDIRLTDRTVLTGKLSGGNQQKVVVARESSRAKRMIIADQPSRGVDIGATELIYQIFSDACKKGESVLLSSLELDEILAVTDRIMVVAEGWVTGIVDSSKTTRTEIGMMMVNSASKQEVAE